MYHRVAVFTNRPTRRDAMNRVSTLHRIRNHHRRNIIQYIVVEEEDVFYFPGDAFPVDGQFRYCLCGKYACSQPQAESAGGIIFSTKVLKYSNSGVSWDGRKDFLINILLTVVAVHPR